MENLKNKIGSKSEQSTVESDLFFSLYRKRLIVMMMIFFFNTRMIFFKILRTCDRRKPDMK